MGLVVGYFVNTYPPGATVIELLGFPGEILLNILRALVLPLIMASLIAGVTSIGNSGNTGRLAVRVFIYFGITTVWAVIIYRCSSIKANSIIFEAATGILWVSLIQPGEIGGIDSSVGTAPSVVEKTPLESILQVFRSMFPKNLVEAAATNNVLGIITFAIGIVRPSFPRLFRFV